MITIALKELETGLQLPKCRKCGCMQDTLTQLATTLPAANTPLVEPLAVRLSGWRQLMQPVRYSCLGCDHCYPAVAQNALTTALPSLAEALALDCDFQAEAGHWPPVVGEYFVVDVAAPVAVSTLASVELAQRLAEQSPPGLALVGKTETENIGIDKIIKNMVTNPALRYLLVAGQDSTGHQTGQTLLALAENGVDERGRVIGSPGKRPVLRNVTPAEVEAFREQVQVINMIGCDAPDDIAQQVSQLAQQAGELAGCGCSSCGCNSATAPDISGPETITAPADNNVVAMDPAGYFVIVPLAGRGVINVEHYSYDHTLLRVIEGQTARSLYKLIVAKGWVTELAHAAYLGRELTKAELSLTHALKFVQDGA